MELNNNAMQENEFEKQVRAAMDNFKLSPSESVWKKVEEQIPKQSSRRRFIAFLLLFTGLIVCGYFFYTRWYNTDMAPKEIAFSKSQKEINSTNKNHNKKSNDTINTIALQHRDSFKLLTQKREIALQRKHYTAAIPTENKNQAPLKPFFNKDTKDTKYHRPNDSFVTALHQLPPDVLHVEVNNCPDTERILTAKTAKNKYNPEQVKITMDTGLSGTIKNQSLNNTLFSRTTNTDKQHIKVHLSKKLQLGITIFYGRSDVVENFLGLNLDKSNTGDYLARPGQNNGGGSLIFDAPKRAKARDAFSGGIDLKKPLSSKSSIITGMYYTNMQTRIETGIRIDSAANFSYGSSGLVTNLNRFYRPGSSNPYTNTYHLFQIPVIYEHKLNRSKKIPVNWNTGLSLTRLFSTNALVFDSYNRAFYNNDNLLHKTQLDLLAGINMQFMIDNKTAINIGPQFQYSLSNLLRSNAYGSQHFFSYGLKTSCFFKK